MRSFTMLLATLTLLTAIQGKLTALQLDNGSPAFDAVEITSSQNMETAMEQVFAADRSCLLFPLGDDYQAERNGARDTIDRTTEVMLQITTKDYSADARQLTGTEADPSILFLKDRVLDILLGSDLGFPRACKVLPGPGAIVQLEKTEGGDVVALRQGWSQILRIRAGGHII